MATIVEKRTLTPVTKLFRVHSPLVAAAAKPGQFVIVRVHPEGERIPLTIADYDADAGIVTIVVQEVGATTRLLGGLDVGGEILDMAGPLGEPLELPPGKHVVGIGGGFGTAALLSLMRELTARGDQTTAIIGARNADFLILAEELGAVSGSLELCTDDGSVGFHGLVTERLAELIEGAGPGRPDHVIAIGPMGMMRAVAETTRESAIPTLVSLDPVMVDGTGMCGGCRITVGGDVKFACVDGPFFDAHQVDYEEAIGRKEMYAEEESVAACVQRERLIEEQIDAR